jgi:hypothetical protein
MASSGKKKTTFAKLARETRMRERRQDKAAKKDARKRAAELEGPREFSGPPIGESNAAPSERPATENEE